MRAGSTSSSPGTPNARARSPVGDIGKPPISADALLGHDAIGGTQIIKQPDVMMAYHLVPELMDQTLFDQNLAFATERTAHGSSLSPAITASPLFRARRWREAMQWFELAAMLDLDDVTGTTAVGCTSRRWAGCGAGPAASSDSARIGRGCRSIRAFPTSRPVDHRLMIAAPRSTLALR